MNNTFLLLLGVFFLNACVMNNNFTPEQSLSIEYMQTAHAISDAQTAIASKNFTLIGFDQRGLIVPGIKNAKLKSIQQHCSILSIKGMGDVVRSPAHHKQMKKVRAYSKAYNLEILNATSCQ